MLEILVFEELLRMFSEGRRVQQQVQLRKLQKSEELSQLIFIILSKCQDNNYKLA